MLKAYFKEYRALTRAGLLKNSYKVMFGTVLFMFLFGKFLGVELEILVFILTSIGYMLDFDANKYVINYSMPICLKRRLHMLYDITIVASLLSVTMVEFRYYLVGNSRAPILGVFVFLMNITGCNLYYYLFCSQEFKKDVLDEDKRQLIYQCIIGGLIGISVAMRLRGNLRNSIESYILKLNTIEGALLMGFLLLFTIWWTKKSRDVFEKTIRGERKNLDRTRDEIKGVSKEYGEC